MKNCFYLMVYALLNNVEFKFLQSPLYNIPKCATITPEMLNDIFA